MNDCSTLIACSVPSSSGIRGRLFRRVWSLFLVLAVVLLCRPEMLHAAGAVGVEEGMRFDGNEARPDRLIARFVPDLAVPEKEITNKLANFGVSILRRDAMVPIFTYIAFYPSPLLLHPLQLYL